MVLTSRVPATRLISDSKLCATRSKSCASEFGDLSNNDKVTIGTSSIPLGLTIGLPTPKLCGNQSELEFKVSYKRTKASVRGTPTLYCTVTTAMPGRETDITCSTSAICPKTCSAGVATMRSTSLADAPGKGINTFAMVTLICGSSSRGVTITANTPSNNATNANKGVICALRKNAAMRPEIPIFAGAVSVAGSCA